MQLFDKFLLACTTILGLFVALQSTSVETIPYARCFAEAAKRYSVETSVLLAIADVESGFNPTAINKRSDHDMDIGIMQIWSNWLPRLSAYNIQVKDLLVPCVNINVGAWILAQNFATHGVNLKSLGAYNAGFHDKNAEIRDSYLEKIIPKIQYYRRVWRGGG